MKVFATGYRGKTPARIRRLSDERNATVVDVRFQPGGRGPFARHNINAYLGTVRYLWVPEWGNRLYRSNDIDIVDFNGGLAKLYGHPRNVLLMCCCEDPAMCHRTYLLGELRDRGFETEELG